MREQRVRPVKRFGRMGEMHRGVLAENLRDALFDRCLVEVAERRAKRRKRALVFRVDSGLRRAAVNIGIRLQSD